jgi:hypothetical protein
MAAFPGNEVSFGPASRPPHSHPSATMHPCTAVWRRRSVAMAGQNQKPERQRDLCSLHLLGCTARLRRAPCRFPGRLPGMDGAGPLLFGGACHAEPLLAIIGVWRTDLLAQPSASWRTLAALCRRRARLRARYLRSRFPSTLLLLLAVPTFVAIPSCLVVSATGFTGTANVAGSLRMSSICSAFQRQTAVDKKRFRTKNSARAACFSDGGYWRPEPGWC